MKTTRYWNSVTAVACALVVGAAAFVGVPANAAALPDSGTERTIESVVPEMLSHTDETAPMNVSVESNSAIVTVADVTTEASGERAAQQADLTVEIDGGFTSVQDSPRGLSIAEAADEESSIAFQPLEGGFRAVSVTDTPESPHSFTYEFGFPSDAVYEEDESGAITVSSESLNGVIQAPWAYDADGTEVDTWYEFDGSTLVQHIDPDSGAVYPIVADPAWSYSLVYNLGVNPASAWSQLSHCFNCEFPVPGAPKALPKKDQKLPLEMCLGPACGPFPVRVTEIGLKKTGGSLTLPATAYFKFLALDGHVEGKGSTISFDIAPKSQKAVLKINAYVKNDFGPLNEVVKQTAGFMWQVLADNLSKK